MKLTVLKEKCSSVPEINVEKGYRYCVSNIDNYKKSLLICIKSAKAKLPLLKSMLSMNDFQGLRIIAHTLIKVTDTIGADVITQRALILETAVLNNSDETDLLLSDFIDTLENFVLRLENVVRSIEEISIEERYLSNPNNMNYNVRKTNEILKKDYINRNII